MSKMKRISQLLCICLLALTFSCETDELFDNENQSAILAGDWQVTSIESISYSSTMVSSGNGESDTTLGSFTGDDIDMNITFNEDNTFTTSGDYLQVLSINNPNLPNPIMVETRFNDFEGGGTWEFGSSDELLIQNVAETLPQSAFITSISDTNLAFDYAYTRTLIEGTVTRVIDVEVSYTLEKN